ncbi:phosphatase 2C-like domain-containing protein [Rhizoctonia solani]|nr:phosphatase 2C-like domain-containing protein [Rhizoctonia solani]
MSYLVPFTITNGPDDRLLTNLGMQGYGSPWNFRLLAEPELTQELRRYANAKSSNVSGLRVDSVQFQPAKGEENASQDRIYSGSCEVKGERWSLVGVFDGHAGEECAEHAMKNLPEHIQKTLSLSTGETLDAQLINAFVSFDNAIIQSVRDIFADPESLASMPAEQLEAMVNDHASGGTNYKKIILAMRGTTAVVSLIDSSRKHLWVAGVGDSRAVLGIQKPDGSWLARDLVAQHNGGNESELQAVRNAHPNEPDITLRNRVLGAIAVTRALGDVAFKIPAAYTRHVFLRAKPGFRVHSSVEAFTERNLTPPYLSAVPDVAHVDLGGDSEGVPRFILLMSDGVVDDHVVHIRGEKEEVSIQRWVEIVGARLDSKDRATNEESNLALPVLRDVYSGSNEAHLSAFLTLESESKWLDDTSIQVAVF